jgi:hypothetical protein
MTIRESKLLVCVCDLCQASGLPSKVHEAAEAAGEMVGITRFMGGAHVCSACREVLGKEVSKPATAAKAVKA